MRTPNPTEFDAQLDKLLEKPKADRETTCVLGASAESWVVTSDDPRVVRKILKLGHTPASTEGAFVFNLGIKAVGFRKGTAKAGREFTAEQRAAASERFKKHHADRKAAKAAAAPAAPDGDVALG